MPSNKKTAAKQKSLVGERIVLRPFARKDLPHTLRWYNDPEMRELIGEAEPITRSKAEKWYKGICADKDRMWYAIVLKDGNRVVGEAGLLHMFKPWRSTDMTVIVGEKDAWGKGYGTDAGHLLLDLAFTKLGIHRVSIGVVSSNKRAMKYWKGLGFKKEGVQRDAHMWAGEYDDFVMMSILENEYKS